MNLKLATVSSCTQGGCQVKFLTSEDWIRAEYSKPFLSHRISIHPGDLVAVDPDPAFPQVVYRVVLATVVGVEADDIIADTPSGVHTLRRAEGVDMLIEEGSQVFFDQGQVLAVSEGGRPTNAQHLRETLFPKIRALYASMEE